MCELSLSTPQVKLFRNLYIERMVSLTQSDNDVSPTMQSSSTPDVHVCKFARHGFGSNLYGKTTDK